jgi:hypothetical protein
MMILIINLNVKFINFDSVCVPDYFENQKQVGLFQKIILFLHWRPNIIG